MEDRSSGHLWVADRCRQCGTVREEAWFVDDDGVAVMALVWTSVDGRMRVRPFPPMLGVVPPFVPTQTVAELLPHVPVGGEPACHGEPGTER